jgi:hypothetical protein
MMVSIACIAADPPRNGSSHLHEPRAGRVIAYVIFVNDSNASASNERCFGYGASDAWEFDVLSFFEISDRTTMSHLSAKKQPGQLVSGL